MGQKDDFSIHWTIFLSFETMLNILSVKSPFFYKLTCSSHPFNISLQLHP